MLRPVASLAFFFCLVDSGLCVDCGTKKDTDKAEYKLRFKLFCENPYDSLIRPVAKQEDTVNVTISLDLKYVEVDEYSNHFWVHSWVVTKWVDNELKWDPKDYSDIKYIQVPSSSLWLPDLSIYNSDMSQIMLYASTDCVVLSSGLVKCAPDLKTPLYCDVNLRYWPYDSQNCSLFIGSWASTGAHIDVNLDKNPVNRYGYMNSNSWELVNIVPKKQGFAYSKNMTYPYLRFDFSLKRHAALYAASIIGPAIVLSGLTLVSFLMESLSVRCVLCCASVLGNTLFLQYVGFHLPADGDTSPNIVSYFRDALLMNLVAVVLAVLVDQMKAAGEGGCSDLCGGDAPQWLVGAAAFVRGRGGKAGQMLLGEPDVERQQQEEETTEEVSLKENEKKGIPQCKMFATFVDRVAFLVFGIWTVIYLCLLMAVF